MRPLVSQLHTFYNNILVQLEFQCFISVTVEFTNPQSDNRVEWKWLLSYYLHRFSSVQICESGNTTPLHYVIFITRCLSNKLLSQHWIQARARRDSSSSSSRRESRPHRSVYQVLQSSKHVWFQAKMNEKLRKWNLCQLWKTVWCDKQPYGPCDEVDSISASVSKVNTENWIPAFTSTLQIQDCTSVTDGSTIDRISEGPLYSASDCLPLLVELFCSRHEEWDRLWFGEEYQGETIWVWWILATEILFKIADFRPSRSRLTWHHVSRLIRLRTAPFWSH